MASMQRDYDVIVIGGGGAGLSAATTAADRGARVLLVDAADKVGGSTALSGGVFWAAETSVQRALGVTDSVADQFRYYMNVNQHKLEPALVQRLCADGASTLEWLQSLGVEFRSEDLYRAGADGMLRGHRAYGHGAAIAEALEGSLSGKSVDVVTNTRIRQLYFEKGSVSGIISDGTTVHSGAVVIATGGFGKSPQFLNELYPDAAKHGDLAWYIGSPHAQGDGLFMGRAVGAELVGHNRGLLLLTTGFVRELEPYLPPWLIYLNESGRRFIDERTEYSVLAAVLKEQPGGTCQAIFDDAARRNSKSPPSSTWSTERLDEFVARGLIIKAESLVELAARLGMPAATLVTTITNYNADCAAGHDSRFFKAPECLQPVLTPPFYAAPISPAVVCWTVTGLRIDREARVLNAADQPIPGLYAAGETTGGMFGECYAAGGASIANAIIFGRTAGVNAAEWAAA